MKFNYGSFLERDAPLDSLSGKCIPYGYFSNQFRKLIVYEEMLETGKLSEESKAWIKETYDRVPTDQEIQDWIKANKDSI